MSLELPETFLGSFKLEKSENFEEFMEAMGVNWMMRKMAKNMRLTKTIRKEEGEGRYTILDDNPAKKREVTFTLGEPLTVAHPMNGKPMTVCLRLDGARLVAYYEGEDGKPDAQAYYFDGEYLVLERTHKDLVVKRWFKREH